jgi:glyoxylase-like metal-dependent hydrolase (beta-lactamase superfamily II)
VALLVEGVLLLGDAVVVNGAGEIASTPEKYSDRPAALDRAVADLAWRLDERGDTVDWLLPSHSGPATGLAPLLEFAAQVD